MDVHSDLLVGFVAALKQAAAMYLLIKLFFITSQAYRSDPDHPKN
jgi:hypothetical protein